MSTVNKAPPLIEPPVKRARLPMEVATKFKWACEREALVHMLDNAL
jgi:hypothetical protein